jgi:phosphocarrier protein
MLQETLMIVNQLGLHARAATKLVKLASQFESDIQVKRQHNEVNGKSIMGVMLLAASKGSQIDLIVDGVDEVTAIAQLKDLINSGFGEKE